MSDGLVSMPHPDGRARPTVSSPRRLDSGSTLGSGASELGVYTYRGQPTSPGLEHWNPSSGAGRISDTGAGAGADGPGAQAPVSTAPGPRGPRGRRLVIPLIAVLVLVLGVGGFLGYRFRQTTGLGIEVSPARVASAVTTTGEQIGQCLNSQPKANGILRRARSRTTMRAPT